MEWLQALRSAEICAALSGGATPSRPIGATESLPGLWGKVLLGLGQVSQLQTYNEYSMPASVPVQV